MTDTVDPKSTSEIGSSARKRPQRSPLSHLPGRLTLRLGLRLLTGVLTGRTRKVTRVYRGPNDLTGKLTPGDAYASFCPEFGSRQRAEPLPSHTTKPLRPLVSVPNRAQSRLIALKVQGDTHATSTKKKKQSHLPPCLETRRAIEAQSRSLWLAQNSGTGETNSTSFEIQSVSGLFKARQRASNQNNQSFQ